MSKEQILIYALKEMKRQYEIVHTSAMRHHHELTRIKERGGDYSEKDLQEHSILKTVWGTIINQLNNLISQYTQSQQESQPLPTVQGEKEKARDVLQKHTKSVFGLDRLTEWHWSFVIKAMEEYARCCGELYVNPEIGNDELCDAIQNACQLLLGIKPDAEEEKWWSEWDESVLQTLIGALKKLQPYYGKAVPPSPNPTVLIDALKEVQHHFDTWADEPERAVRISSKVITKALQSYPLSTTESQDSLFSVEEVLQFADHYTSGMAQGKWTDPSFKGNYEILKEFFPNKYTIHKR